MHCSLSPKNHAWQNCFSCSSHYKFNEFKFISSVLLFYLFHTGSTSLKRQIYFTVSNDSLFCAPQVYQRGQRSQDSPNLPWRGMLSPWHAPPQGASQPPTSGGFEMTRRSKVSTPSGLVWSESHSPVSSFNQWRFLTSSLSSHSVQRLQTCPRPY